MSNELMTKEEIQNAVGRNALQIGDLADAVGILQNGLKSANRTILEVKEAESSHYQEFLDYKEVQKDKEYIEPADTQELKEAVHNRIADLLKQASVSDADFGKLFGAFARKCWSDCKKYANVIGTAGVYTKRKDFQGAKEYIGMWTPHGYSVPSYIEHLRMS